MSRLFKTVLSVLALAILLVGCDSVALWHQTNDSYAKNKKEVEQKKVDATKTPPAVITKQQAYVDTKPISLNHEPAWYHAPVAVNGAQLPFSFYVTQLLGSAPVAVHMGLGVNASKPVSMHYTGNLKGALTELSAKSNYFYDYDLAKNTITWSALQTKVFDISFIPGVSKYSVGNSGGSSSSSSSSSSSGTAQVSGITDITATGEYSSIANDSLSVWDDMKNTITTLLSPQGKLSVSQATTTITVRDHPGNISDIGHYLSKMNKILSKQVHFDVQVLDVTLNKQFQYGIDWDKVQFFIGSGAGTVDFSANFSSAAGGILTNKNPAIGTYTGGTHSKWDGTSVMIQALEQQGKVTIVTQPSLTTLNDQVAQIAIQSQQSYLASQTSTLTGASAQFSQQSLQPGLVNTGFQMYILPKIQGDKVYLEISSVISQLTSLTTVSQTGQTTEPDAKSTQSAIQVPNIAQKNFNQRSVLRNGQTLVLAGYKSLNDSNQKDTVAGLTPLGGLAAQSVNEELVFLITPTILDGDNF